MQSIVPFQVGVKFLVFVRSMRMDHDYLLGCHRPE